MAMFEIYQRRYEVTEETEDRVAELVSPRVGAEPDAPATRRRREHTADVT